jgi:hypothetical protein
MAFSGKRVNSNKVSSGTPVGIDNSKLFMSKKDSKFKKVFRLAGKVAAGVAIVGMLGAGARTTQVIRQTYFYRKAVVENVFSNNVVGKKVARVYTDPKKLAAIDGIGLNKGRIMKETHKRVGSLMILDQALTHSNNVHKLTSASIMNTIEKTNPHVFTNNVFSKEWLHNNRKNSRLVSVGNVVNSLPENVRENLIKMVMETPKTASEISIINIKKK